MRSAAREVAGETGPTVSRPPVPAGGDRAKRSKVAAWIVLLVGAGMIVAPSIFGMWQRAPRGAQMIKGFSTIMTARNVPVIAGYGRAVLGGFGNAPAIVQDAAAHFSGGKANVGYQQATDFIRSRPDLGGLAYLQTQMPNLGPPFSSLLSVLNKDQPYFSGMAGLPNFSLFPFFFVIPGLVLAIGAAVYLRRLNSNGGDPVKVRRVARLLAAVGLLLIVAALAPMPPGFHSIRTVGPNGAAMLADFQAPVGDVNSAQAVMSMATVRQFDGYVATMRVAAKEIVPAVQDASSAFAGQQITSGQALAFLASDPNLSLAYRLATGFAPMYAMFHRMLTTMAADMGDYRAVLALPSFRLFPWFFIAPGAIVLFLAGGLLGGARRSPKAAGNTGRRDPAEVLAFTGIVPNRG